jgi:transcriptional regulator with XRE-family HTH domain
MAVNGISGRIKKARIAAEMTQSDLAHAANLSKGFMSDVEAGKRNISLDTLTRLADALKVPVHWLVVGGKQATVKCPTCAGLGKITIG